MSFENNSIDDFRVVGINYRNSDTALRGKYAIQDEQYEGILNAAAQYGVNELFVLSTCNRTEIYGFAADFYPLENLICDITGGSKEYFKEHNYCKNGKEAIAHIFHVAAGLDSQILGDYEIIGQLKHAVHFSQEKGHIGIFIDRLFKSVLQACRDIRSKTQLSSGTVSVAHAAVLFLKKQLNDFNNKHILVIGLGKIGKNTCKNLLAMIPGSQITLMNRTEEKAMEIAQELKGAQVASFDDKKIAIEAADVVIVATNAASPVLSAVDLKGNNKKILLDLSIPNNIHPDVKSNPAVTLVNVDDLSKINDQTLKKRAAEIPQAESFIIYHIHQFAEWYLMRKNVPVIKAVKEKLSELNHNLEVAKDKDDKELMQKVINAMAQKMKEKGQKSGCYYIEAINSYLSKVSGASR